MDDPFMVFHWFTAGSRSIGDCIGSRIKGSTNCCLHTVHAGHMISVHHCCTPDREFRIFSFLKSFRDLSGTTMHLMHIMLFFLGLLLSVFFHFGVLLCLILCFSSALATSQ